MTLKRLGKKIAKITGIVLGIVAILLVVFHFWFLQHAKQMLEDTVDKKSNGKIKLKIEKLHYNYFTRKMVLDKAVFLTTDTLTAPSAYRFEVPELRLNLKALFPLLLNKKLLIDSLYLQSPLIHVSILRYSKDTTRKKNDDISIPYEMGKIYKSIQDALQVLEVNRFDIEDGKFSLLNKVQTDQKPLTISNIHFHIDNLQVGKGDLSGKDKILFSDNVVLRSSNQDILFPDGRHRLSFSRFRINLQQRLVEFDSCTIAATKKDTAGSSFEVFFDALKLTNIDFDTLYRAEVIKADSVYCVNPKFSLHVELGKNKGNKKEPPKLENIIKQLTGDLQLGYVIVENADFNIQTSKNGKPSSFTFSKNNFEMQGLSIDQEAAKPISVKSFAMAIRNYENFIKDSSYIVKFDSVVFKDDRITLSNFLFNKLDNGRIINTFSVPRFSLEGLSWDYLVFEKKLKAKQAIMYQPHISYTFSTPKKGNKERQTIFQSLGAVNDYMDLQQLNIERGNIDLKLKNNVQVQLENATLAVESHSLLHSTKLAGIKNSLTSLQFTDGKIQAGNISISLNGIQYTGTNGKFAADQITINDKERKLAAALQNASVEKLIVNEINGNVSAEDIKWKQASIKMNMAANNQNKSSAIINLQKIQGLNTTINSLIGSKAISTTLATVSAAEIRINPGKQPIITGLIAEGSSFQMNDNNTTLSITGYNIDDKKSSSLTNIKYKSKNKKVVAEIFIPYLQTTPDIQSLIAGNNIFETLQLTKPIINIQLPNQSPAGEEKSNFPNLQIGEIKMSQPVVNFSQQTDSGMVTLEWQGVKNTANNLQLNGLKTSDKDGMNIELDKLTFYLTDFNFINAKGKKFSTGEGKVAAQINNIFLAQQEGDNMEWKSTITSFDAKDFLLDSIGKSAGRFIMTTALLKNLQISSANILNMQKLAASNPFFQINNFTGQYSNSNTNLQWSNIGFNRTTNIFTLDSFSYSPSLSRDSFLATKKFQTDYLKAGAGSMQIGPVDIERYIRDTVLHIRNAIIDKAYLADYKDKNLPFNVGLIKPLPVDLIKKLPLRLAVDSTLLTNANVEYTEVSEKTKQAGTIPVTRLNIAILNAKNYNIKENDSLAIRATGYILDTVWVRLRLKESYTDSLGGFLMTLRLKPGDLTVLNSVLIPMASVKLLSGQLDTLDMRAIGREYLSLGEMKMFYSNLKIQLLKDGKDAKQTFFTRLLTFAANTFLIKKNNKSRTGNVFFIRQRDRSAINYLIKIAMSGMSSSVGVKKNKKMIRKYKKELEKRGLPPIDFE